MNATSHLRLALEATYKSSKTSIGCLCSQNLPLKFEADVEEWGAPSLHQTDRLNRGPDRSQLLFQSICVDSEMRFPSLSLSLPLLYSSSSSQSAGCTRGRAACESRIHPIWGETGNVQKAASLWSFYSTRSLAAVPSAPIAAMLTLCMYSSNSTVHMAFLALEDKRLVVQQRKTF